MAYTTYPTGRPITYTIEYRENTLLPWSTLNHAYVQRLEWALAPAFHGATVVVHYGAIDGEVVTAPTDLENALIRIVMTDEDDVSQTFLGYVSQIAPRRGGPVPNPLTPTETVASGDLVLTILDTAHRLSLQPISGAFVTELNGSVTRTQTPVPFNLPSTRLRGQLLGNRASDTEVFGTAAYYPISSEDGEVFTALDVLNHLAAMWYQDGNGVTLRLAGQYSALDYYTDAWDVDDQTTYWDLLNRLIQPTRGLTFQCTSVGELTPDLELTVYSLVDSDVLDGSDTIIPASTSQITTLNLASAQDIDDPEEHHIPAYHKVIVEGEPLRVCFTMADAYNTLADGWEYADELAMLAEDEDDRDQDAYSAVFRRFVLPPAWNGTQFIDPDYRVCLPRIDPATGLVDTALTQPVYPGALVLDDDLPLAETGTHQPRPILALHKSGDTWQRMDKGSGNRAGVHVKALDDEPGVLLKGPKPTTLGMNHGDDAAPYDWESMYLTVSMQTLDRTRIETTITDVSTRGAAYPQRVKRIRIPDLHVWYVVQGTITDADGSSITQSAGEYARDDTATLRRIAALAVAWYGRRRTKYRIRYRRAWVMPYLGYLVVNADTGAGLTPAGTVISRIVHEFRGGDGHEKQTTEFATEWHDLDIAQLFGRAGHSGRSARRNRPRYDRPAQPLLATTEGVAGYVWAVITSAGTGPTGPHTVNVWTAGYYDNVGAVRDPDITGATAYAPGLGATVEPLTGQPYAATLAGSHYELLPEVART